MCFIKGDAAGNLTLLGPVASEGTKAMLVRQQLSMIGALSSIALENIFYALSVAVMVLAGVLVFVATFPPTSLTRIVTFGSTAAAVVLLSTYDEDDWDGQAQECGAVAYVAKSAFGPDRLTAVWAVSGG